MTLSRNDTAFLKGIAMLMIVLHNFCHWLPGSITENEYTFGADRIEKYLGYIVQGGPHLVLNFFSHYGHYGVPLFLFLSGYGLVKKYERSVAKETGIGAFKSDLSFLWSHAVKLWRLMLPAIMIYWFCQQTFGKGWNVKPTDLLAMVTYTANFFYRRDLILGPWWFFSLMMQLYAVYRFGLYRHRSPRLLLGVVAGCFLLQAFLYYGDVRMTPDWNFYVFDKSPHHWDLFNYCRYNFPTSMLPFGLGIAWARHGEGLRFHAGLVMGLGTVLLLTSAFRASLWLLSPIFLLMALVPLAEVVKGKTSRRILEFVGIVSPTLFAVHPIVRAFTIQYAKTAEWHHDWMLTDLYLLGYVVISLLAAWLLQKVLNSRFLNI